MSTEFSAQICFNYSGRDTPCDPTEGMPLPKFKQRIPDPLTTDEIGILLDSPQGDKLFQVRNLAMLELMYATGMRVSELVGLSLAQVDLQECRVKVSGKGGKERIVPFGHKAKEALEKYLVMRSGVTVASDRVFVTTSGRGIGRGAFWSELKAIARKAGLRCRVTPHQIRHSAATHLLEGGADIRVLQEYMGHSTIATTQRYAHVSTKLLKATCVKAHPRF